MFKKLGLAILTIALGALGFFLSSKYLSSKAADRIVGKLETKKAKLHRDVARKASAKAQQHAAKAKEITQRRKAEAKMDLDEALDDWNNS